MVVLGSILTAADLVHLVQAVDLVAVDSDPRHLDQAVDLVAVDLVAAVVAVVEGLTQVVADLGHLDQVVDLVAVVASDHLLVHLDQAADLVAVVASDHLLVHLDQAVDLVGVDSVAAVVVAAVVEDLTQVVADSVHLDQAADLVHPDQAAALEAVDSDHYLVHLDQVVDLVAVDSVAAVAAAVVEGLIQVVVDLVHPDRAAALEAVDSDHHLVHLDQVVDLVAVDSDHHLDQLDQVVDLVEVDSDHHLDLLDQVVALEAVDLVRHHLVQVQEDQRTVVSVGALILTKPTQTSEVPEEASVLQGLVPPVAVVDLVQVGDPVVDSVQVVLPLVAHLVADSVDHLTQMQQMLALAVQGKDNLGEEKLLTDVHLNYNLLTCK